MSISAMASKKAPYTRAHAFLRGEYNIGHARVPYFNITMTVGDAISDLKLQRDVILDPKQPVSFTELFQRDIDEDRRDEIVKDYLLPPHQIKFFNALTVVLLPTDPDTHRILPAYPESPRPGVPETEQGMEVTPVGPVQIQSLPDTEIGRIAWDKDSISAVIVDGQHRFSALKAAYSNENFPWRSELLKSSIPVLLLVFDARVGFSSDNKASSSSGSVLDSSRSVFIDLNKNAKVVSKSRQFLLDDRDITAVAMRALIDQQVGKPNGSAGIAERLAKRGKVPVSLIDWHGDVAKFDRTMYLSTILTMYEIADITLGDGIKIDATEIDKAGEQLDKLIARFRIDDSQAEFGLKKELERCENDGEPFTLTRRQISAIADAYAETRGRLVISVLTQIEPYQKLLSAYESIGVLNGEYEQWAALDSRGQRAFMDSLEASDPDLPSLVRSEWTRVKEEYPLAFQVVFQKSLASAIGICYQMQSVTSSLGLPDDPAESDFGDEWTKRFNRRLSGQLSLTLKGSSAVADSIWHGSVINASGNISFTDSARKSLTAAIIFSLFSPIDSWGTEKDAVKWLKSNWMEVRSGATATEQRRFFGQQGSAWARSLTQFERTTLKAAGKPDPGKDGLMDLAVKRAGRLLFSLK